MVRALFFPLLWVVPCLAGGSVWIRDGWRQTAPVPMFRHGTDTVGWVGRPFPADTGRAPGLVLPASLAWYACEDRAADQVVLDGSGNRYDAATAAGLTASIGITGAQGGGFCFSGGDRLVIADPAVAAAMVTEHWSISMGLRRDGGTDHSEFLGFFTSEGGLTSGVYHNSSYNEVVMFFHGTGDGFTVGNVFGVGGWVHLVILRDGDAFRAYVGGTLVAERTFTLISPTAYLTVGGFGSEYADSRSIDDVRVFDRSLTGAEISALGGPYPVGLGEPGPTTTVSVSFSCDGGTMAEGESYVLEVSVGNAYGPLPVPTREGFTFAGWFSYDLTDYVGDLTTVSLTVDHTLYAIWY